MCKAYTLDTPCFIVYTNTDEFKKIAKERRKSAIYSGAQIISTDYPPEDNFTPNSHTVTFDNGKTASKVKWYSFTYTLITAEKQQFFCCLNVRLMAHKPHKLWYFVANETILTKYCVFFVYNTILTLYILCRIMWVHGIYNTRYCVLLYRDKKATN